MKVATPTTHLIEPSMDMTFIKFCENLAERLLGAFPKGYFLIVIHDRVVQIDRYLGCAYIPGVLSRVKLVSRYHNVAHQYIRADIERTAFLVVFLVFIV